MKIFTQFLLTTVLLFVFICSARAEIPSPVDFKYILKAKNLDPAVQSRLREFLSEAEELLPLSIKKAIHRPIRIHFVPLDESSEILVPCGPEVESRQKQHNSFRHIYGATRWSWFKPKKYVKNIDLHQAFIPVILQGRQEAKRYTCGHQDLYRLALATLIHETAHLYDFSEEWSPKELEELNRCERETVSFEMMSPYCDQLFDRRGMVSDTLSYQKLMGWKESFSGVASKNKLTLRSPDPYEFADVSENFAVNLEYFLLDPEYACRRPAAYRYFSSRLRVEPYPDRACQPNRDVRLAGAGFIGSIDPTRVYQIHYLFASRGQAMISQWGHAMLRVIVCAPERMTVDEQCLKDTEHHIVVSFRANVNDLMINAVRGIFGGYPSQLFLYSLNEIVDEYTRGEMRELISIPLKLTDEQQLQLMNRIAELYWSYHGKYYLISNNCATETADLIRAVLSEGHPLQYQNILTPLGLFRKVIQDGLADSTVLKDQSQAKKLGYFFPSNRESLENAFGLLVQKRIREYLDLDDYLDQSDAIARRQLYQRIQLPPPGKDRRLTAAFFLLESQVRRILNKVIDNRTVALMLNSNRNEDKKLSPEVADLMERYRSPRYQMNPWFLVQPGTTYGVALKSEVLSIEEMIARQKEFFDLVQRVRALVSDRSKGDSHGNLDGSLKEEYDELNRVKDNILFFSKELRFE